LDQPICIHLYRHPVRVAESLRRRDGFPLQVGLALWEFCTISALRGSGGFPVVRLAYEDLVRRPVETLEHLACELARAAGREIPLPVPADRVRAGIDPDLVRCDEPDAEAYLSSAQLRLYASLRAGEACPAAVSAAARETLDSFAAVYGELEDLRADRDRWTDTRLRLRHHAAHLDRTLAWMSRHAPYAWAEAASGWARRLSGSPRPSAADRARRVLGEITDILDEPTPAVGGRRTRSTRIEGGVGAGALPGNGIAEGGCACHTPAVMPAALYERFVTATRRPQSDMQPEAMEWFGMDNLCRAARLRNRALHSAEWLRRRRIYRREFPACLAESGGITHPLELQDGWAMDTSGAFPHLDRVLDEAEALIAERGGRPRDKGPRGFIQDLLQPADLDRWPSFLDFATSADIVGPVCQYMRMVPRLSDLVPPGIRFVESTREGQLDDGVYRTSQLYHLDFHDRPVVYVIVFLRDITPDSGPFVFLPKSASARVKAATGYGRRRHPYRLSDEDVYRVVPPEEAKVCMGGRGTVLILDSSACFHYGSRDAVRTRYQLMIAYVSPCRTDFADRYMPRARFPQTDNEPRLRRLLLRQGAP
jgi:hypothetical protein